MIKTVNVIDINQLKTSPKFTVFINNKPTDLQIGDKLHFPENCSYLKTIVSITIFEDKTVNYTLKWYDGSSFQTEVVSINDLKLLNLNIMPKNQIGLSNEVK